LGNVKSKASLLDKTVADVEDVETDGKMFDTLPKKFIFLILLTFDVASFNFSFLCFLTLRSRRGDDWTFETGLALNAE